MIIEISKVLGAILLIGIVFMVIYVLNNDDERPPRA